MSSQCFGKQLCSAFVHILFTFEFFQYLIVFEYLNLVDVIESSPNLIPVKLSNQIFFRSKTLWDPHLWMFFYVLPAKETFLCNLFSYC